MSTTTPTTTSLDDFLADAPAIDTADAAVAATPPVEPAAIVPASEQDAALAPTGTTAVVEAEAPAEDKGPHPKIAKRIIFDGNTFDIPTGTPEVILLDNNALRRAYATAMARPEVTQAQMEEGTTVIDGHTVPTLTLRVRPQVKGVSVADTSSLINLLAHVPRVSPAKELDGKLVKYLLAGQRITLAQAVRAELANLCDIAANPPSTSAARGASLCSVLDMVPAVDAIADLG